MRFLRHNPILSATNGRWPVLTATLLPLLLHCFCCLLPLLPLAFYPAEVTPGWIAAVNPVLVPVQVGVITLLVIRLLLDFVGKYRFCARSERLSYYSSLFVGLAFLFISTVQKPLSAEQEMTAQRFARLGSVRSMNVPISPATSHTIVFKLLKSVPGVRVSECTIEDNTLRISYDVHRTTPEVLTQQLARMAE